VIVCIYVGFDIISPPYRLAVHIDKAIPFEWIVGDRITGWEVFAIDWPAEHIAGHIRMDIFLSLSQHALPSILIHMKPAI
jgi:hypothetical protein